MDRVTEWNELAAQLGVDSIRCSTAAGSGHPTSSLSAAHLLAVLYADHLRLDVAEPHAPGRRPVRAFEGPRVAAHVLRAEGVGAISDEQLLTFRKFGSPVQGHPVPLPDMPWVDVATGSLGQGLPIALGMALGLRLLEFPGRVWVLMGDSEIAEGSVWESMAQRELPPGHEPDRHPRHEPPGAAGTDDAAVGGRRLRGARPRVRLAGHRGRRPRRAAIDEAYTRGGGRRGPDADRGEDAEGPRRVVPAGQGGMARQGLERRAGGGRDRGARRRATHHDHAAQTRATPVAERRTDGPCADAHLHGGDRDAQGVRRGARRARRASGRRRPGRRGGELHPHRGLPARRARSILRDVHRRAGDARRGGRVPGGRAHPVRRDVRGVPHARLRLRTDGRDQPGEPAARRLARGRVDRRGRALPDGARGSRHACARSTDRRCCIPADGTSAAQTRRDDGRPARHQLHAHDAGEDAGALRRRTRRSRSAEARRTAPHPATARRSSRRASR